jgi:hypothetical protein
MKYAVLLLLLACQHLSAQEGAHLQLAYQLLEAMKIDAQLANVAMNIKNMQARQLSQLDIPEAAQPAVQEYLSETLDVLLETFNSPSVRSAYADAYMKVFSEAELQDVLAFYRSEAGRKFLDKQPELNKYILKVAEEQIASVKPEMFELKAQLQNKLSQYQVAPTQQ